MQQRGVDSHQDGTAENAKPRPREATGASSDEANAKFDQYPQTLTVRKR
jgi:hypothetical protein